MDLSFWDELNHFKKGEKGLYSPDNRETWCYLQPTLMYRLDALRGMIQRPFVINSGYRTRTHNTKVGGESRSQHLYGRAVDVSTAGWSGEDRIKLVVYARRMGFKGIGVGKTYVHLDVRTGNPAAWTYDAHNKFQNIPIGDEPKYV